MIPAGRVNREIMRLAVPAILTNIAIPLLGLCDTAIAGHLGAASYIGAIAVGAMMLNVVYWGFGFLRAGTTGLAATSLGAGNYAAVRDVLFKAIALALAISAVVVTGREMLLSLLLKITSPDPDVSEYASRYFMICVWAAPAQLCTMAVTGWFIGMQTTVAPMVVSVGTNLLNIVLSLLFVLQFGMGFEGVAYGTLAATWAGLIVAAVIAMRILSTRCPKTDISKIEGAIPLKKFFSVNTDLFLRSLFMIAVSLAVTAIGSRMGTVPLAANAVIMQFFIFFSYFMDGFAFAAEALVGKALGAHDYPRLREYVRILLCWSAAMAVSFFIIYLAAGDSIAAFLTDRPEVKEEVATLRFWILLLPPITVAAFIFDGIFIGLTRIRPMLLSTFVGALLFVAVEWAGAYTDFATPQNVLWCAFESYLLARGAILAMRYSAVSRSLAQDEA